MHEYLGIVKGVRGAPDDRRLLDRLENCFRAGEATLDIFSAFFTAKDLGSCNFLRKQKCPTPPTPSMEYYTRVF